MAPRRCAVCKVLKETCVPGCITAPHFPSGDARFEDVNEFFGAANVRKILSNIGSVEQRELAANSLSYAAEARRRDPISGCHGIILHHESILKGVDHEIELAENELETNFGSDLVPKFVDLPMPDDFLTTPASLDAYIEKIKSVGTVETNQMMQLLKREDPKIGVGRRADGASTSAAPSTHPKIGVGHGADGASTSAAPSKALSKKPQ